VKAKFFTTKFGFSAVLVLCFSVSAVRGVAQTNSYQQTNLVSDMTGVANNTDPKLENPWGISFFPGSTFWVSDNKSGYSTIYDANGVSQFSVLIPAPAGDSSPSAPTGTVINQTAGFKVNGFPSQFLFATENGTIAGWYNSGNAVILADRSSTGAVYTGLAMITNSSGSFLLAPNFKTAQIDVFDSNFNLTALAGSLTDPTLPAGYAPFGIQPIGSQLFVTYALQNATQTGAMAGAGDGYVSVFDDNGNFLTRFASAGTLNAPWGLVQASANFGMFSNDILVGNFGDGTINAFDANGTFVAQLEDPTGAVISNGALWGMVFGAGGTGDPNTLYFTAGFAAGGHGLFGSLAAAAEGAEDFSLGASPTSGTVNAGGSTNFTLTVTPANGFSNLVTFSCVAPTGISCTFSPTSVTPAGAAVTTTMTASAAAGVHGYGALKAMGTAVTGLGLFGCFLAGVGRRRVSSLALVGFGGLLVAGTIFLTSCGTSNNASQTNPAPASIVVTATSGSLTHTTTINLIVQ
jgi:uncharacterized protein (TIGR03118 family)